MRRITLPLCALWVATLGPACGVSQSRYDRLLARAHEWESKANKARGALKKTRRRLRQQGQRHRPKPTLRARARGASRSVLKRRLRHCRKRLAATRRPLVLSSHTREQDIGRGRRRATTVTLMPGTVILPVKGKRALRNRRARRAEKSLRRAIARKLSMLASCYHNRAAKRRRPPSGAVSFAFEVTRSGRTRRVSVVHRLGADGATVRCALRVLRRLRLPRQRRTLWAVFPLELHAGKHYAAAPPIPARRRR